MLRRLSGLLLALSLAVLSPLAAPVAAQNGSPVAVDLVASDSVAPAAIPGESPTPTQTPTGNTPAGATGTDLIFPLPDVYVAFNLVTASGNTTAIEEMIATLAPLPTRFRSDNARAFSIETTAGYQPNISVCIIYGLGYFADVATTKLLRLDGGTWSDITNVTDLTTVCGYSEVLGTFAVAEIGETPTSTPSTETTVAPTETATPFPTETDTPSSTATATASWTAVPTETPTSTATATLTPTETATSTSTPTETPVPTSTATATPSNTPEPTLTSTATSTETASPTETHTATATPSPTSEPTNTSTATPTPSPTPTDTPEPTSSPTATNTPSHTPEPTFTPTSTATETPTRTHTPTSTPTESSTPPPTNTPSASPTLTATATATPARIHFATENVYLTFSAPVSGTTSGHVLDGSSLPAIPEGYLPGNAWFFFVETTAQYTDRIKLCVVFDASGFANPPALLRSDGSIWAELDEQLFDSGAFCGYTPVLGAFALVERAPATVTPTPTSTPTRTPTATRTSTPSPTATYTPSLTPSRTPTRTPTSTATSSSTPTSTHTPSPTTTSTSSVTASATSSSTQSATPTVTTSSTATLTSTATSTPSMTATPTATNTATLGPGSYPNGTALRTTTRVNLRTGPSTSTTSKGVLETGTQVTATGPSTSADGRVWVPVDAPGLGTGWIAGDYLRAIPTPTPTRTPAPPTATSVPGSGTATRTATRPPGGFIAGDTVRTTTRLNLRSAPSTASTILTVLPANTYGTVTGSPIPSGSIVFYPVSFPGYGPGYVASSYLQRVTTTPTPTRTLTPSPTVAGNPLRWTTTDVNMRTGPGTGYRVIETLAKGTQVTVVGATQRSGGYDWYPIEIIGIGRGWVAGKFLSTVPPL